MDSHVKAVTGHVSAASRGLYTFVWDNTSSMLRGKTVVYQVEVIPPAGQGDGAGLRGGSTGSLLDAVADDDMAAAESIVISPSVPL